MSDKENQNTWRHLKHALVGFGVIILYGLLSGIFESFKIPGLVNGRMAGWVILFGIIGFTFYVFITYTKEERRKFKNSNKGD